MKYAFCYNGRFTRCTKPNTYGGEGASYASAVSIPNFAENTKGVSFIKTNTKKYVMLHWLHIFLIELL